MEVAVVALVVAFAIVMFAWFLQSETIKKQNYTIKVNQRTIQILSDDLGSAEELNKALKESVNYYEKALLDQTELINLLLHEDDANKVFGV